MNDALESRCASSLESGRLDISVSIPTEVQCEANSEAVEFCEPMISALENWPMQVEKYFKSRGKNNNGRKGRRVRGGKRGQVCYEIRSIWANGHRFVSLPPDTFATFVSLVTLSLSNNQLVHLNPRIADLSQLRQLYLSKNKLTGLPNEMAKMKLEELRLDDNKIGQVPNAIVFGLKQLQILTMRGNPFIQDPIPREFAQSRKRCFVELVLETHENYSMLLRSTPQLNEENGKLDIIHEIAVQRSKSTSAQRISNLKEIEQFAKSGMMRPSSVASEVSWSVEAEAYSIIRARARNKKL